jgi:hypothetical protein
MPGGSGNYAEERDESDKRNGNPIGRWRQRAATEFESFVMRTSQVDRYEGEDGDNADVDEEEETSEPDDASKQNQED